MVYTTIFTEKYTGILKPRQITGPRNRFALCSRLCFTVGTASDPDTAVNMMKNEIKISVLVRFVSNNGIAKRKTAVL
jgi:hypothetical protein